MKSSTLKEHGEQKSSSDVRILFVVLSYDDLGQEIFRAIRIEDDLIIGREGGDLQLGDRWASSNHAKLEVRGELAVLHDLGSLNGTFVNDQKIERQVLADGDRIEIGHTLLVYRELSEDRALAIEPPVMVGPTRTSSGELALLMRRLQRIAPTDQPILILADSGAGKEIVASEIHRLSGRRGALVAVDCGAIPETLFESTLFGHAKGAFTGAEARSGELFRAQSGTFFLDEIGNLSPANQAKLLRAIESKAITPLGEISPTAIDVRFVAATNRAVDEGDFREDLLHRLAGFVARLPPLAERREDLGFLVRFFLAELRRERIAITVEAARSLFGGELGGNVRQLRTALRSACALCEETIETEHLNLIGKKQSTKTKRAPGREEVEAALRETGGNVSKAGERLGVHARQVYRWIDQFEIPLDDLRRKR